MQRGAGGGGEEAGGSTQTAHLPDQEEAVGEFSDLIDLMLTESLKCA